MTAIIFLVFEGETETEDAFCRIRVFLVSGEETLRLIHDEYDGGNNEPMESYSEQSGWGSGGSFWD